MKRSQEVQLALRGPRVAADGALEGKGARPQSRAGNPGRLPPL